MRSYYGVLENVAVRQGWLGKVGLFSAEPAAPHLQEGAENSSLGPNLALARLSHIVSLCFVKCDLPPRMLKVSTS